MINIDKISKVVGYLTLFPENHYQSSWYRNNSGSDAYAADLRKPGCGTTMCVAGWTAVLFAPDNAKFHKGVGSHFKLYGEEVNVSLFARSELGLTADQAAFVFYMEDEQQIITVLRYLVTHPNADSKELSRNAGV